MTCHVRLACVPVPIQAGVREAMARRWLVDRELTHLPSRAVEKRRCEFVAGRVAAKAAVARLRGVALARDAVHTVVASGARAGQPIAMDDASEPMAGVHLSITHSDGVAIAAAARTPIGIDLTPVEPRPRPFDDEAFLDHELDDWLRLLGASAPERLRSIAFAAKEAALKWLGTGLRAALHDVRVTPAMLGTAEPCADLRAPVRRVVVELHVRESASPGGDSRRRTRTLHGVVSDLGAQAFVGFAEQPWELAPPSREAGEDREPSASK